SPAALPSCLAASCTRLPSAERHRFSRKHWVTIYTYFHRLVQDWVQPAMSGSWTISVAGQTYGPYSTEQMQAFAAEGRLARQSLVAPAGETEFRRAAEEPELAGIFQPSAAANERAVAQTLHREPREFGRADSQTHTGEWSHLLIVADMKSGSIAKLEEEIA